MKLKAFSYNEILIVAAVAGLLVLIGTPFYLQFINNNDIAYTSELTIRFLRSAQSKSMNREDDSEWGVCKIGADISIYRTSCTVSNIVHSFTPNNAVTITGLADVRFIGASGNLTADKTISISRNSVSRVITINRVGGYEIN